jgi:hypothetical protein
LLLVLLFNLGGLRGRLASERNFESQEIAQEIGEKVNHSGQVVYVAPYYGVPLEYYGELSGVFWPMSVSDADRALGIKDGKDIEERLNDLGFSPDYFVITDFDQFNTYHSDLKEHLAKCPLIAENDRYLIYEACTE